MIERRVGGTRIEHACTGCYGQGHVDAKLGPTGHGSWRRTFILPDGRHLSEDSAKREGIIP